MKFNNIYFINGTAYAGKSTMVKLLAEKYNGIACEENYHDRMLDELSQQNKPVFVDTNIPIEILLEISDKENVLIMLAEPEVSVKRFFERPDKEKQFLYQLLLKEDELEKAMDNFRECLKRVNSVEIYNEFLNSGFNVILRDEKRTIEEMFALVEKMLKL